MAWRRSKVLDQPQTVADGDLEHTKEVAAAAEWIRLNIQGDGWDDDCKCRSGTRTGFFVVPAAAKRIVASWGDPILY